MDVPDNEQIKVTPEYLKQRNESLTQTLHMAEQNFFLAKQAMLQLDHCFYSEVVVQLLKNVRRQYEAEKTAFTRLLLQIQKLNEIADIYAEAERSNTNAGS